MNIPDTIGLIYGVSCIINIFLTILLCLLVGLTDNRGITNIEDATLGCFVTWVFGPIMTLVYLGFIIWMIIKLVQYHACHSNESKKKGMI